MMHHRNATSFNPLPLDSMLLLEYKPCWGQHLCTYLFLKIDSPKGSHGVEGWGHRKMLLIETLSHCSPESMFPFIFSEKVDKLPISLHSCQH